MQPPRGGAPVLVELLARAQSGEHEVGVACRPALARRLADSRVTTWTLDMDRRIRPVKDAGHWARLLRIVRRFRPDVIHAHSSKAGALARAVGPLAGVPVVFSPHNFAHTIHEGGTRTRSAFYWLERAMAPLTAHLHLTYEAELRDALATGLARPGRVSVIPNGIDTAPLLRLPASDAEPPTIGTYARLWPQKRVDRILHAAETLAREGRAFDLKILGDGPTRDQLEGLARRLGLGERVTFASDPGGPVQAMPLLDIFVLSSDQEAFPLTPMEAMAAARPVVATRVGAVAEIVEDETTGLLVDPGDDSALVAALRRLLDDRALRARLGAAGRARAEERFDVSVMAQRLDAVYRAAR